MKITIGPKEAELIREAFTVQKQVLEQKLADVHAANRERQNLKGELERIKMESFENPYVIVKEHYEEKKAKYLNMLGVSDRLEDRVELHRKIDSVERLAARYDYILDLLRNPSKHRGRYPSRTKPFFSLCQDSNLCASDMPSL